MHTLTFNKKEPTRQYKLEDESAVRLSSSEFYRPFVRNWPNDDNYAEHYSERRGK